VFTQVAASNVAADIVKYKGPSNCNAHEILRIDPIPIHVRHHPPRSIGLACCQGPNGIVTFLQPHTSSLSSAVPYMKETPLTRSTFVVNQYRYFDKQVHWISVFHFCCSETPWTETCPASQLQEGGFENDKVSACVICRYVAIVHSSSTFHFQIDRSDCFCTFVRDRRSGEASSGSLI
jgi:hypothetical protein